LGIRVALHHVTRYRYDRLVTFLPHVVRLRPAPHCRTPIESYSLCVQPRPHFVHWQQDPFANYQARLTFPEKGTELTFEVDLVAEMTAINPFDFFVETTAEHFPFTYAPALRHDLAPYLEPARTGARFAELVEGVRSREARSGIRTIDVLVELNRRVQRSIRYDIRMAPGVFPPEETLGRGHGSCRDFAWLLVQLLRSLGLAARFVSGYSIQLKADEKPIDGPAGVEQDATDLHAWAEVFLPGAGWVGLDATSGLLAGEGHIPLACTPDPETAAPVSGTFEWARKIDDDRVSEDFSFSMSVIRIAEEPRVSLPYRDEVWNSIDSLGRAVDRTLAQGDVRLTMGGEPTFVAADDPESAEWNTDALGPSKRTYASRLVHRLYERFTPGGLLHEGQGKWYPGEPLPRWALSCYFRKDGSPIWSDASLFARDEKASDGEVEAERFIKKLATILEVQPEFVIPAFEDAWYFLWRERRLPVNVDPFDSRLDDESERARLARIFEQGLNAVVGYALPLAPSVAQPDQTKTRWRSGHWFTRPERLYLIPGESPMGFRLPLDSLPWVSPEDRAVLSPADPFAAYPALPPYAELVRRERAEPRHWRAAGQASDSPSGSRASDAERGATVRPLRFESASGTIRTCLCVEPRGGVLHVFMPPMERLEDYISLSACVEAAAASLRQRVRVEGYHPPSDPRIGRLQVTPDPGVIEVNIQPAHTWDELVSNTTILYEEARNVGLRAEKFMLDGRHSGTGGGNHVVLGGPTPADSPILRRPDLLRSLIAYWLNHPSLSFLFSGLFVGPTSQAPRVDEARNDSLYELDIAFRQVDLPRETPPPPWLVDRVFRNLLVDVTGNTHRTEFCIDKLYSPDGPAGRQGLVELRSFEMPPHSRMSVAQQLVVRALVARFWNSPYRESLVHWGTTIHDRFALPHFVREDFNEVLEDLSRAGFPFDANWFQPHHEFRFPLLGKLEVRGGLVLELRQAIEPWNVLGEEAVAGATARYVDSSVERVEVKVRGMTDDRHIVTCNGRRVPLHPTGTNGEFVAGVRYRAWKPPLALHPNIPVHSPLVFDLLDRWNERAVAGCTYYVSHPGGLGYDLFPRNALEADARRATRFSRAGHSPGKRAIPEAEPNPRFPLTLDLRR
jgi:uncharacterized protein (DUF2126 family)/transglutaminase-like putative cysteine protease